MAPIVHGLESVYSNTILFTFLDIDDPANKTFKSLLGFRYQPHFILLDGQGNIIQQWVGSVSAEEIASAFEAAQ